MSEEELEFLYQKAMRSADIEFIDEVTINLEMSNMEHDIESDPRVASMIDRVNKLWSIQRGPYGLDASGEGKFDFLVGDSQLGHDWYQTRK
jgi:hypothetical protein